MLSVLLFSSREVKPPLSRVTDSSPGVMCFPAEIEKKRRTFEEAGPVDYCYYTAGHLVFFNSTSTTQLFF